MEIQNVLNDKTNSEIGTLIFNRLAGKYWLAWKTGEIGNLSYIELAKKYGLDIAEDEFMDDCDAYLTDDEVSW